MSKRRVTVKLTPESIADAIKELEDYRKWLETGTRRLLDLLAQEGLEVADVGFASAQYDGTNDVTCSIEDKGDTRKAVVAVGNAVLFIEFGTGVLYPDDHPESSEHGMVRGEYGYGQGGNVFGWTYRGDPGTNGMMIYQGWQRGKIHTFGNPANKCMYNSRKDLEDRFEALAKEAFKR